MSSEPQNIEQGISNSEVSNLDMRHDIDSVKTALLARRAGLIALAAHSQIGIITHYFHVLSHFTGATS